MRVPLSVQEMPSLIGKYGRNDVVFWCSVDYREHVAVIKLCLLVTASAPYLA